MTEAQYQRLLPFKPNWLQQTQAGEVHCNINYWTALVEVGKTLNLPIGKAIHLKISQSCQKCMAEIIREVMQKFDQYEQSKGNFVNNKPKWKK